MALALVALCAAPLLAAGAALAQEPAAAQKGYRKLAPGVETSVPMTRNESETGEPHDLVELKVGVPNLEWTPQAGYPKTDTLYFKSNETMFRRGIWQLQFSFKPLRMIRVDLPQPDGNMRTKVIWYMVYRVTNPGQHMTPVQHAAPKDGKYETWHKGVYTIERVDTAGQMLANIGPIRFIPIFKFRSLDLKQNREWTDSIVPLAKEEIYRREQPPCKLEEFYNTVEMAKNPIPLTTGRADHSVWGFVTWVGGDPPNPAADEIDPEVDYFSIYIWGLTNAYQWKDPPGVYKAGDPPGKGRQFVDKVLKINFSRLGDEYKLREDEIRLGITNPKYGKQVDWEWLYR